MRLIDADKLPYAMKDYFDGKKTIGQIIDDAPTVEMAENCISREAVIEDVIKCTDMNEDTMEVLEDKVRALQSVTPKTEWIPIKIRPMTEEEKEHFFEYADSRYDDTYTILDCPLPDDGQEVILSVNGYVCTDIFCRDSADGCYFETYDIDDVEAWMPLPQPYKVESEDAK